MEKLKIIVNGKNCTINKTTIKTEIQKIRKTSSLFIEINFKKNTEKQNYF